jgi:isopentenyldiphosphate isomerase
MKKDRKILKGKYDPHWRRKFFSGLPKNPTEDEIREHEWIQQEKKRPKVTSHNWMLEKWLKEQKSKPS